MHSTSIRRRILPCRCRIEAASASARDETRSALRQREARVREIDRLEEPGELERVIEQRVELGFGPRMLRNVLRRPHVRRTQDIADTLADLAEPLALPEARDVE